MTKPQSTMTPHSKSLYNRGRKRALREVLSLISETQKYYPITVFPEPEPVCAPDRYSAAMARDICKTMYARVSELLNKSNVNE